MLLLFLPCMRALCCSSSCATQPSFTPAAGPPVPVDTPLNLQGPSGAYVRTDNGSALAYAVSGSGSTAPEQYLAYHASNTSERSPVLPGQTAYMQSEQTGMWCRLAPSPSNATQLGMVCDQPTPATATAFTYTGDGLAVDGIKLVSPGPGQPLLLANTTTAPVTDAAADNLSLTPVASPAGGQLHRVSWHPHQLRVACYMPVPVRRCLQLCAPGLIWARLSAP